MISRVFSTGWRLVKSLATLFADTFDPLRVTLIVRLHCGCTISELVNTRQTVTLLEFSRAPGCRKLSHFTGAESGWPQIVDAVKATTLHSGASLEKSDAHELICEARRQRWRSDDLH